jgi:hypothetical protein
MLPNWKRMTIGYMWLSPCQKYLLVVVDSNLFHVFRYPKATMIKSFDSLVKLKTWYTTKNNDKNIQSNRLEQNPDKDRRRICNPNTGAKRKNTGPVP